MSQFIQMYKEMCKAYNAGAYDKAAEIGELAARSLIFSSREKYFYHEAIYKSLIMRGEWQRACVHLERVSLMDVDADLVQERNDFFSESLAWLHFVPDLPDDELYRMHTLYARLFSDVKPYGHQTQGREERKKIRVGYLSPDFYEHIVTNFAVQLYAAYDKSRFEVHLYHVGTKHNEVTEWLQEMADGWHDLHGLSAAEAAAKIYRDQVDILVDLAGHTKGGRTLQIMAYKPAPIQLSGIGYFNTTGLPAVDYFLTDNYCDPAGNERYFTEKLLRLPHSHFCFTPSEDVLYCHGKWQLHSPVVFGSFSNFFKINETTLRTWRQILEWVPGSRLLLKNVHPKQKELADMARRMQAMGFDMSRVEMRLPSSNYLDEYKDMDIALDPFPYPGGGTTCEAIYMGVPVISLYGRRHGSRFGFSLLRNMGLEELTAATEDEYIERAVTLANAPDLLSELHNNLREIMQASPVMNVKNYLDEVQSAYEDIYTHWLRNISPDAV